MVARVKIVEPPAAVVDWSQWASDVKLEGRITRPIHIKEMFGFSQSTVMAIWQGKPVGLVPFLRVCKRLKMSPTKYLWER